MGSYSSKLMKHLLTGIIGFVFGMTATWMVLTQLTLPAEDAIPKDKTTRPANPTTPGLPAVQVTATEVKKESVQESELTQLGSLVLQSSSWSAEKTESEIRKLISKGGQVLLPNNWELIILLDRLTMTSPMKAISMLDEMGLLSYQYRDHVYRT